MECRMEIMTIFWPHARMAAQSRDGDGDGDGPSRFHPFTL